MAARTHTTLKPPEPRRVTADYVGRLKHSSPGDRTRQFIAQFKVRGEQIECRTAMRRVLDADLDLKRRYVNAPVNDPARDFAVPADPDESVAPDERVKRLTRRYMDEVVAAGGTITYSQAMHRVLEDPRNRAFKRAYAQS